jgi:hypothetical protein
MSSLPDTRRALADRRDNGRVSKLNSLGCAIYSDKQVLMSALGQKQTLSRVHPMSAIPPKADMQGCCDRISRRWVKGL